MPKFNGFKEDVLKCKNLLALEISQAAAEPWYTDRDDHPARKRLAQLRRQHLNEEDGHELAKVMSSDAHKLSVLGRNAAGARKLTRLKMESLCFDAFRIALLDGCARTRLEDLVPAAIPLFVGMKLEGGFLGGQVVRFSKNLTCVIGGRGTGKSTLLESLRAASGNETRPGVVDSAVWPDRVSLIYQDEAGVQQVLTRGKMQDVVNETEPDGPTVVPIESYSQGETASTIQHCDKDPAILLRFLDGFVDLAALTATDQRLNQGLLDNEERITELQREVATTGAVERSKHAADGKLRALTEENAAEVVELEAKLAKERMFRTQLTQQLKRLTATFRSSLSGVSELDQVIATEASSLVVGADEFSRVLDLVRGYATRIRDISSDIQTESQKVTTSLASLLREWERKEGETQAKIEAIRLDLEGQGVRLDLATIRRGARDATELAQRLHELRARTALLNEAKRERDMLVVDRTALKFRVFTERQRFATALTLNLRATITDYAVTLKYHEGNLSVELEALPSMRLTGGWATSTPSAEVTPRATCTASVEGKVGPPPRPLAAALICLTKTVDQSPRRAPVGWSVRGLVSARLGRDAIRR